MLGLNVFQFFSILGLFLTASLGFLLTRTSLIKNSARQQKPGRSNSDPSLQNKDRAMVNRRMILKLVIDKNANKVLFAEVEKDFVDFLFVLLSLPIGKLLKLLPNDDQHVLGCLGTLYESVECFDENYIDSKENMVYSFKPKPMPREGYVKDAVKYTVMDDLEVLPPRPLTSAFDFFLDKCKIKDLTTVERKVVDFGGAETLKLLEASMKTKSVLTSIFLGEKGLKDVAGQNS